MSAERLFEVAFKRKEEAAKLWREKNELKFNDEPHTSPIPTTNSPLLTQQTTQTSHNSSSTREDNALLERLAVPPLSSYSNYIPDQANSTTNNHLTTATSTADNTITNSSSSRTNVGEISSEAKKFTGTDSDTHSSVDPNTNAIANENAPQQAYTTTNLLSLFHSLTKTEQLIVISFIVALLYLHLSFHSLQDLLDLIQYDYSTKLRQSLHSLPVPSLSSLFSAVSRVIEELSSRANSLHVLISLFLILQFTVLFDSSCDKTDILILSFTRSVEREVHSSLALISSLFGQLREQLSAALSAARELREEYERKTPRVVRLVLSLALVSFLLRYVLIQVVYAARWVLLMAYALLYPYRWYGMGIAGAAIGLVLIHLYLSNRQTRRDVIVRLSQHVKSLLEGKIEQQAAVDYLYYEIQDTLTKHHLNTTDAHDSSRRGWKSLLSFSFTSTSSSVTAEPSAVSEGSGAQGLSPRDLAGHSLASLWNDVQKEVGRDKRVRTFLMFIEGAMKKCWKLTGTSNNTSNTSNTNNSD